jgi:methionyl-tRNA synthetase
MLGYEGTIAGPLLVQTVREDDVEHAVLTGDYASWAGRWKPSELPAGQPLREPKPLFAKLDADIVVQDVLARMEAAAKA